MQFPHQSQWLQKLSLVHCSVLSRYIIEDNLLKMEILMNSKWSFSFQQRIFCKISSSYTIYVTILSCLVTAIRHHKSSNVIMRCTIFCFCHWSTCHSTCPFILPVLNLEKKGAFIVLSLYIQNFLHYKRISWGRGMS
jgi:hypothetical protein